MAPQIGLARKCHVQGSSDFLTSVFHNVLCIDFQILSTRSNSVAFRLHQQTRFIIRTSERLHWINSKIASLDLLGWYQHCNWLAAFWQFCKPVLRQLDRLFLLYITAVFADQWTCLRNSWHALRTPQYMQSNMKILRPSYTNAGQVNRLLKYDVLFQIWPCSSAPYCQI
jgi:hypothetical protein